MSLITADETPRPALLHRLYLIVWLGPAALLGVFLWHTWQDPDIWYHLAHGREVIRQLSAQPAVNIIMEQENSVNIYWLFQAAAWLFYGLAGVAGVTAFFALLWYGIFTLWARRADILRYPIIGVPLSAAAFVICFPRYLERPEVVSYLLLSMQLLLLERLEEPGGLKKGTAAGWLLSQVVWVNVHGYFFLGPLTLAAWLAGDLAVRRSLKGLRPALPLLGGLIAAGFASPFGAGAWKLTAGLARYIKVMRNEVVEFRPYAFTWPLTSLPLPQMIFWIWVGAVAVLAAIALIMYRKAPQALIAALGISLAVLARRNAPLAVIMSGPLLGTVMARWKPRQRAQMPLRAAAVVAAAALSAACLIMAIKTAYRGSYAPLPTNKVVGTAVSPRIYPTAALAYLSKTGFRGLLFAHPGDGSFLEFHKTDLRLYGDSRFTDVLKTREFFGALADPERFLALDWRYGFDAVLVNLDEEQTGLMLLATTGGWIIVYADLYRCLLVSRAAYGRYALPLETRFYSGEDLSLLPNAICAVRWMKLLAESGQADIVLTALRQFSKAPYVPAEVISEALKFGRAIGDAEIIALASGLLI